VAATYSLVDDGSVRVLNRGYDPERKLWKEALEKARLTSAPDVGQLKVSFFGPFYGGYNIIELDQAAYSHALVCGPSRAYRCDSFKGTQTCDCGAKSTDGEGQRAGFQH
jgi:apolipoprotein D and lipocalin family protein